jgi:NADH dehydrogenase
VGEEKIRTRNVVWAAGVTASPLGRALGVETDRVGRVMVQPDLSVPAHPEVFVVGDLMNLAGPDGTPLPGVAQVAMQGGKAAARNIARTLKGEPRKPFRYFNKGNMATIGRRAAILQRESFKMKGWLAWIGWLFIHVMSLIGFRNRVIVFMQWAWSYLTWQRGARLITGDVGADLAPPGKPLGTPEGEMVPPSEGSPMSHDTQRADAQGQAAAGEREGGWMGGDRAQASRA